jgi:hypothetical protein
MNLIPVLNKTSPWAHTKLELDMHGVPGKLVKYALKKKMKRNCFPSHKLPKQQSTNFWSKGILGVKWNFVFYSFDQSAAYIQLILSVIL